MFSLNQIYLLNSAKEEGKAWLAMAFEDAMEGIRRKFDEMNVFELFRKDLFNQRDPLVILEIERMMDMNHPMMDPVDVHKLMMDNNGYEKLAEEMEDVKLSYKVGTDWEIIQLKLEFRPRPPILRIRTPPQTESPEPSPIPPLPESEEELEVLNPEDSPRRVKRQRVCAPNPEECGWDCGCRQNREEEGAPDDEC